MRVPDEDPAASDLREATLAGARSVFLARLVVEVLLLGSTVALARLLGPAELGRAVIALIVPALASSIVVGVSSQLLIQRPVLTDAHSEAAAWLGVVLGLAFTVGTFLTAALVARPLFGAQTARLVELVSPAFLILGVAAAPQALLQRRLAFRRLSQIEIVTSVLATATSVALAVAGLGATALVVGALVGLAGATALMLAAAPMVLPRRHGGEIRELLRYGIPTSASALAAIAYSNIDYAILGARLGATDLGLYWRAYQLGAEYQGKISIVMLRIAFPVYSRSLDLAHLRRMRRRIVRLHATVIFPLLGLLIVVAPNLVPFVYGEQWRGAVVPTQILAGVGMMAAVLTGIGQLMFALGEVRRLMWLSWISVAVYATTIFFVAPYGVRAVCIADAGLYFVLLMSSSYLLGSRQAGIPMRSLWEEVGPALAATAGLVAVGGPLSVGLNRAGLWAPAVVTIVTAVVIPIYLVAIRWLSASSWADLQLLRSRVMARPVLDTP